MESSAELWQKEISAHAQDIFHALARIYKLDMKLTLQDDYADSRTLMAERVGYHVATYISAAARTSRSPAGMVVPHGRTFEQSLELAKNAFIIGEVAETQGINNIESADATIQIYLASSLSPNGKRIDPVGFREADFARRKPVELAGEPDSRVISGRTILELVNMRRIIEGDSGIGRH